jgi:hypothetical protein
MAELKPVSTLMSTATSLGQDEDGEAVDQRNMIGSLLYLMATRPDIQFCGHAGHLDEFCGRAGHLDEFCFRRKRIERRHVEYARD